MIPVKSQFTVLFEDPFWVGIYERECAGKYEVCKITFGAEPKDYTVYAFLQKHWRHLPFGKPVAAEMPETQKINPKRMQRQIQKQTAQSGISTKAQQALSAQREQNKLERINRVRVKRAEEKERQFVLRQAKKQQKHRGH